MKYSEIVLLSTEEIVDKLKSEKEMLSKFKFAHAISPIENPLKMRSTRRVVAQLNTELTKRSKKA